MILRLLLAVLALAAAATAIAQTSDVRWPREITSSDGVAITVYQPQLESWAENLLRARAAVSVLRPKEKEPNFGVIELTARTEVDRAEDLVTLRSVQITKGAFPGSGKNESERFLATLRAALPDRGWPVSAQALQANLAIVQARSQQKGLPLKNDPPQILFRTAPSMLVIVDGEPATRAVKEAQGYLRVINTTALILLEQGSSTYYLWALERWWQSKAVTGEWQRAGSMPAQLDRIRAALAKQFEPLEGKNAEGKPIFEPGVAVTIVVATRPTELLQSKGEPKFSPIPGTQLLFVENSDNDIFMELGSQAYYVLISGRWFTAKTIQGPWSYAAAKSLPADFAKIPAGHPMADVLASIPGTPQAREAAIANQIPQTATVQRDVQPTPVTYDGEPQWKPIESTPLAYAVNTGVAVIRVDEKTYYMVQNGVWFVATSPTGPWTVATSVPAVIYSIPTSSPLHYVTYVRVYSSTDSTVFVGYTPGYYGTVQSSDGVVVYGTGYYYPPYIGSLWYPYGWSYGYGWGFTGGFYFGFGIIVMPPWYVGGCCWTAPPSVIHHGNVQIDNSYNRWGGKSTSITGPGGRSLKATQVGNTTLAKGSGSDNIYAGRDGQVYRRGEDGDWQKYGGRGEGWQDIGRQERPSQQPAGDRAGSRERPSQTPSETRSSLDRQYQSRAAGEQRAQQFRQGGGGYRGGGGARAGGGGRRR